MPQYRAYIIGNDGHVSRRVELLCPNDTTAKHRAKQLVEGHDVELWQLDDLVAVFRHEPHRPIKRPHPVREIHGHETSLAS